MKREDVQRLLSYAVESEHRGYLLAQAAPRHLAELCRRWLAVEDAPMGTITVDAHPWPTIDDAEFPDDWQEGKRVRIVPEQGEG